MTTAVSAPTKSPFSELLAEMAGESGVAWLQALREAGATRFAETGLPSGRHEEWRFTPLTGLGAVSWGVAAPSAKITAAKLAPFRFGKAAWPTLVIVDGRVAPELSKLTGVPKTVTVMSLAQAIDTEHAVVAARLGKIVTPEHTPFTALNAATFTDGLFLHVPRGVKMNSPVHLLHVTTSAAANAALTTRSLVVIDEGATASLIESYVTLTDVAYVTNSVVEIALGANARLEHVRNQQESEAAWHFGFTQADQARDSHYRSFALSLGARLARHNLDANHQGSNVESLLYGLYVTRNEQVADTHSAIHHNHPHCNSWEVYKGVLGDKSHGVFNGKVLVAPEAQKTDAKQTNRNLLLSDHAKVDTKPQLEIFADDVRCTHGATVGKLNELQRYYLRTRGIGGKQAERLLIWAFAAEVMVDIAEEAVRKELERVVRGRLEEMT